MARKPTKKRPVRRKTKPGYGKRKGSAFEREFCKELSLWWSSNKADDHFWRSVTSGGRATQRTKKGTQTRNAHGDIASMSFLGGVLLKAITFELKTGYASANVLDLLEQKGLYLDWIAQARASCRGAGTRYWAVVHRRPQSKEPLLIAPANLFLRLCQGVPNNAFTFDCGGEKIVICKLKWLFWCKPEQVKYQIHKLLIREKERHAKRQEQK